MISRKAAPTADPIKAGTRGREPRYQQVGGKGTGTPQPVLLLQGAPGGERGQRGHHGSGRERRVSGSLCPPGRGPSTGPGGCEPRAPRGDGPVPPQGRPEAALWAVAAEGHRQRLVPGALLDQPGPEGLPRPLEAQRQEGCHQQRHRDLQGGWEGGERRPPRLGRRGWMGGGAGSRDHKACKGGEMEATSSDLKFLSVGGRADHEAGAQV